MQISLAKKGNASSHGFKRDILSSSITAKILFEMSRFKKRMFCEIIQDLNTMHDFETICNEMRKILYASIFHRFI